MSHIQGLGKTLNLYLLNLGALLPLSHLPLIFKRKKNYGNVKGEERSKKLKVIYSILLVGLGLASQASAACTQATLQDAADAYGTSPLLFLLP